MIYFVTTATGTHGMKSYLRTWGRSLASSVEFLAYDLLPVADELPVGTYIFSEADALSPAQLAIAAEVQRQLAGSGHDMLILNEPARTLHRLALLRAAHERGTNRFTAHIAADRPCPERFPVFVRSLAHQPGSIGRLLHTQEELDRALDEAERSEAGTDHLIVVEFCDTSGPDGVFRKYAAFRVGEHIVPRHLFHSGDWVVKFPDLIDEGLLQEEREYLEQNPHREWIREVFDLASVEYGRLDYSLLEGVPQVWEINMNPVVFPAEDREERRSHQERFARGLEAAFRSIDRDHASGEWVPITLDAALLERAEAEDESFPLS